MRVKETKYDCENLKDVMENFLNKEHIRVEIRGTHHVYFRMVVYTRAVCVGSLLTAAAYSNVLKEKDLSC